MIENTGIDSFRRRHSVVICFGSNVADAHRRITEAVEMMSDSIAFEVFSQRYCAPSENGIGDDYLNMVASGYTDDDTDRLNVVAKWAEHSLGRTVDKTCAGIVPADIDVVMYDGIVIKQSDYEANHFMRGFKEIEHVINR